MTFPNTATSIFCLLILFPCTAQADPNTWLSFLGGGTSSVSAGPTKLSLEEDGNLVWKVAMPGRSVAGPIVVDGLVVSTSSEGPDEENLYVTAVELETGKLQWQQQFRATGRPFHHPTSACAAPSAASDGERIVAFYSSNDLACLSVNGDLLWYRGLGSDYPKAGNDVGMASSPVIVDGAVIVQVEAQGDSFAAAIEMETGKNRWRISRPASSNWTSPLVVPATDQYATQVILQSREDVVAVDPANGTELWRLDEPRASIPSPTGARGMVLLPGDDLMAVQITGNSEPETVWRDNQLSPRNASVTIAGDRIYSLKGSVLVAASLDEGKTLWKQRLSGLGGTWATPAVADKSIYIFDQSGVGLVLEDRGDSAEIVSEIELGSGVLGSPAVASGALLVRSQRELFCFK